MSSTASYEGGNQSTDATLSGSRVDKNLDLAIHPLILSFIIMVVCLSGLFISCGIYLKKNPQQDEKEITKIEKPRKSKSRKHRKTPSPESFTLQYYNSAMKQSPKISRDPTIFDMEMKVVEEKQQQDDVTKVDSAATANPQLDLPCYDQLKT